MADGFGFTRGAKYSPRTRGNMQSAVPTASYGNERGDVLC